MSGGERVTLTATAVDDARSIETLGRRRQGSGVVIDVDGLVLTIGYLILEAERVDLVMDGDRSVPARVVAYDLGAGPRVMINPVIRARSSGAGPAARSRSTGSPR